MRMFLRDTADMSRRNEFVALQEIRKWNVDTVVRVLEKNGLRDCGATVRKRGITGDILLDLTEMTLAGWKRDLNLSNIRKLSTFVQELNKDPVKYRLTENELNEAPLDAPSPMKKELSVRSIPPARSGSSSSHSSWGSDFDDDPDDSHPGKENGVKRSDALSVSPQPPAPVNRTSPRPSRAVNKITIPQSFNIKPPVIAAKPKGLAKLPRQPISNKSEQLQNSKPEEKPVIVTTETEPSEEKKTQSSSSISRPAVPPCPPTVMPSHIIPVVPPCPPTVTPSYVVPAVPPCPPTVTPSHVVPALPPCPPTVTPSHVVPPGKPNLPKPPGNMQGIGRVENLISNLNFNSMDEEEYLYNYDGEMYPDINTATKKLEEHLFNVGPKLVLPPSREVETQEETYEVCQNHLPSTNGYESDEYTSIKETETGIAQYGSEDAYLLPVTKPTPAFQSATTLPPSASPEPAAIPPPLPAKPRPLLPDLVVSPVRRTPSPSKTKAEDSGSSGDGVTGRIGGLFRKKREAKGPLLYNLVNRLGTEMADAAAGMKQRILHPIRRLLSRYDDVLPPEGEDLDREKAPSPELKKTVTPPVPNYKPPPPPPVEQRPLPLSSTQGRPLPQPPISDSGQRGGNQRRPDTRPPITSMPWYHNVDRQKAVAMLRNGEDGAFLIRPSSQVKNPLTLTLWYNGRLYNISVRQRPDGRYALGFEKANEQSFSSIEELVVNYQSEKLVLYSGGEQTGTTVLTTTPRKDSSK